MSNDLEVSLTVKQGAGRVPFAAVEYNINGEKNTVVYRSENKHSNDMFLDVLNYSVFKDLEKVASQFDNIKINLDKNKFSKLLDTGAPIYERDENVLNYAMSVNSRLENIRSQSNVSMSFDHENVAHIYNGTLSYENMSSLQNEKNSVVYGSLIIAKNENPNFSLQVKPVEKVNLFIDVIESEDKPVSYVAQGITIDKNGDKISVSSDINPQEKAPSELVLQEYIERFFEDKNDILKTADQINIYCSKEHTEEIKKIVESIGAENVQINDQHGQNIRSKIIAKIEADEDLRNYTNELNSESNEMKPESFKTSIYISDLNSDDGRSYGAVIKVPGKEDVLYEIEGRSVGNDQKDDIFEVLKYISGKVRNGHFPANVDLEVLSENQGIISALQSGEPINPDETVAASINNIKSISYEVATPDDLYIERSIKVAENAQGLLSKNILQSVEFENKEEIKAIKENSEYSFLKKAKKSNKNKM